MLLPALVLICASVAPEYVVVVGPGVSTGRVRKALKTMSAATSHTVRFRLAAKGETGNVAVYRDCHDPDLRGRIAYADPRVASDGTLLGGRVVIGCEPESQKPEVLLHELGHLIGFVHGDDVCMTREGVMPCPK